MTSASVLSTLASPINKHFTQHASAIALVVGEGCNLKCRYCWFHNRDQSQPKVMPLEIVEKLIADVAKIEQDNYLFVWLGGEPLLAGIDFYRFIVEHEKKYLPGKRIKNSIQTNALALSDEWVDFLLDNPFHLGISIDGPKEIHDRYRLDPEGNGSFDRIYANIRQCQEKGLNFGVIATVTDAGVHQPEELFSFFADRGINSIAFNFAHETEGGRTLWFSISNDQYFDFLSRIFDCWIERDDPRISVREIDNVLRGVLGHRPTSCIFSGTCRNYFSIDHNGDVLPCERFSSTRPFGNILDVGLNGCLESEEYHLYAQRADERPPACKKCEWLKACNSGCYYHRRRGTYYFCSGRKRIYRYVSERLRQLAA